MSESKKKPRCPICREPVESRRENEHFPFCTERCRMMDLGKWLDEDYTIPVGHTSTERSLPDDWDA